jgi:hypothetical protein
MNGFIGLSSGNTALQTSSLLGERILGDRKLGMAERVGQAIKAQRINVFFADPTRELPPSMHAYVRVERGPGTRNAALRSLAPFERPELWRGRVKPICPVAKR